MARNWWLFTQQLNRKNCVWKSLWSYRPRPRDLCVIVAGPENWHKSINDHWTGCPSPSSSSAAPRFCLQTISITISLVKQREFLDEFLTLTWKVRWATGSSHPLLLIIFSGGTCSSGVFFANTRWLASAAAAAALKYDLFVLPLSRNLKITATESPSSASLLDGGWSPNSVQQQQQQVRISNNIWTDCCVIWPATPPPPSHLPFNIDW